MAKRRKEEIEIREGAGGKSAFIAGTRVRVTDIARLYSELLDEIVADRIVQSLPTLTREQVLIAIDYWREHTEEISAQIEEERLLLAKLPYPS